MAKQHLMDKDHQNIKIVPALLLMEIFLALIKCDNVQHILKIHLRSTTLKIFDVIGLNLSFDSFIFRSEKCLKITNLLLCFGLSLFAKFVFVISNLVTGRVGREV